VFAPFRFFLPSPYRLDFLDDQFIGLSRPHSTQIDLSAIIFSRIGEPFENNNANHMQKLIERLVGL
jgi:hypothetical protein